MNKEPARPCPSTKWYLFFSDENQQHILGSYILRSACTSPRVSNVHVQYWSKCKGCNVIVVLGWVPCFTSCAWPLPSSHLYIIFLTAFLIFTRYSLTHTHTHTRTHTHTHTHTHARTHARTDAHTHPTSDQHLHKWIIQNTDNQSITFFHIQLNNSLIHRGPLRLCVYVCVCVCVCVLWVR